MEKVYQGLGVSAGKEEVHAAVRSQSAGLFPGAFCKANADRGGDPEHCVVLHADGAGTKSIVAYLMAQESKEASHYASLAQDATVMNTDDLLCVGALGPFYLSNTIGRNPMRVDGKALEAIIHGYDAFAKTMEEQGVEIINCGGETADLPDLVRTVLCDATMMVRMKRADFLNIAHLQAGAAIVAVSSYGKAHYESFENSGIGSNGLTLARHMLLHQDYRRLYPEVCAPELPEAEAYAGPYHLGDRLEGSQMSVGEALLSPCRSYLPLAKSLLAALPGALYGMIHCTGGGLTKSLHFGQGLRYVKKHLLPRPPIFEAIAKNAKLGPKEMYEVFNCGQRLEVYCAPHCVSEVIALAAKLGLEAQQSGFVEAASGKKNELVIEDRGSRHHFVQA